MAVSKTTSSARLHEESSALFSSTLQTLLARLPERSRGIVEERFGIASGTPKTLEEIG